MADLDTAALGQELIEKMRNAFNRQDWDATLVTFEQLSGFKTARGLRLEATCLAARVLVAERQRSAARALLREAAKDSYNRPVHYEFLARAFLDLKQYKEASEACARAEEMRLAELSKSSARPLP